MQADQVLQDDGAGQSGTGHPDAGAGKGKGAGTRTARASQPSRASTWHRYADEWHERQIAAMIGRLRELVLAPPANSERLHVAFLDDTNRFLSVAGFGEGRAFALSLSLRELFRHALSVGARGILMAHNHPSGDCRPSALDIEGTRRIASVAQALDIEILDHLIFSENGLYSMRRGAEL